MPLELYITFLAAVVLLGLTPGPMFALLIANSMAFGVQAGLRTLAGSILGLSLLVFSIILGLNSIVQFMADWFAWIKLAGAVYLIWLGFTKLRTPVTDVDAVPVSDKKRRFFTQGLAVSVSNPKVLLFLAAFLPQFLSPAYDVQLQLAVYGASFVIIVATIDFICVLATDRTRLLLSQSKRTMFNKVGGLALMFGGVWLLFSRRN